MSLTHGLSGAVAPQLTIDGDTASSTRQIEVINPATAQVFAAVPDAGAEELDRAAAAAPPGRHQHGRRCRCRNGKATCASWSR